MVTQTVWKPHINLRISSDGTTRKRQVSRRTGPAPLGLSGYGPGTLRQKDVSPQCCHRSNVQKVYMGVSINGEPQNGWFIRENPHLKWMILGVPLIISGNSHIDTKTYKEMLYHDISRIFEGPEDGTIPMLLPYYYSRQ